MDGVQAWNVRQWLPALCARRARAAGAQVPRFPARREPRRRTQGAGRAARRLRHRACTLVHAQLLGPRGIALLGVLDQERAQPVEGRGEGLAAPIVRGLGVLEPVAERAEPAERRRQLGRVVRVVLAHLGESVREVRLRVRELGHAPARAHQLEHHPADLVDEHRLADALRHRRLRPFRVPAPPRRPVPVAVIGCSLAIRRGLTITSMKMNSKP